MENNKEPKSIEEMKSEWDKFADSSFSILKASALSELKGGLYVLKLVPVMNKEGEVIRMKYEAISFENKIEIESALEWIMENKGEGEESEMDEPYFMISQRPPNHRFFESILARRIGKPTDEVKVETTVTHVYTSASQRAMAKLKKGEAVASPYTPFGK